MVEIQLLCRQHYKRKAQGGEEKAGQQHSPLPTFCSLRGQESQTAVLGNWTSCPKRDWSKVISSVINSGPQLFCALLYLQAIPVSKGPADHMRFPGKGWGKRAQRAGFHPWCVALDRCLTTQRTSPGLFSSSFLPECS